MMDTRHLLAPVQKQTQNGCMKNMTRTALFIIMGTTALFADWSQFRGNAQRTGYYPEPVGYPHGNAAWKISLTEQMIISSPSVQDNTVYIGTRDSCIYAIEGTSGNMVWKKKTGGWVDSSPLLWENMLIVGSSDNTIYVLEKENGKILSTLAAGFQFSSPGIINGMIISGLGPPFKKFSAYGSHNPNWDKIPPAWSINFSQMSYSSPAVFQNTIVIGASDGRFYGIHALEKDTVWSIQTEGGIDLSTPAIDDTTAYFAPGNYDKHVYAVDCTDGMFFWKSAGKTSKTRAANTITPNQFFELLRMSPAYRNTMIARLRARGITVPAVFDKNRSGGSSLSLPQFYPYGGMKTSSVAVDKRNVYVIQKELGYPKPRFTLLALDKYTGVEQWRFSELRNSIPLGYCSSPLVTSSVVFFGWGEGKLYACDTKTGVKLWEDSLSGDIISSPAIANGMLYAATITGDVYAYRLAETAPGLSFRKSTYCYPNPARNGVSNIQVYSEKSAAITMVVYNIAEKPVFRVTQSIAANEKFTHVWNLKNVANGVYFAMITIRYADGTKDKKILKIAVLH